MKRKIAILAVSACALVPVFMVTAPSAGAAYIQGCVHWSEQPGPWGAFGADAFNRCTGNVIRRAPDVINGPDGGCTRMIPNHRYKWDLWSWGAFIPPKIRGWKWC